MKRILPCVLVLAILMTAGGCGAPSRRVPVAGVSPNATATVSASTGTPVDNPPTDNAPTDNPSPSVETTSASPDGGGTTGVEASPSRTPDPAAAVSASPQAVETGAGIIVRSGNELSSSEKEALLKDLETELDGLFGAIEQIDESIESAVNDNAE